VANRRNGGLQCLPELSLTLPRSAGFVR
jgi:hypothetical protein